MYDFDHIGMTGLHWACKRGHIQLAQELIEARSDCDAVDMLGRSALKFAVMNRQLPIVFVLLRQGCNPWSVLKAEIPKEAIGLFSLSRLLSFGYLMTNPKHKEEFRRAIHQTIHAKFLYLYLGFKDDRPQL